MRSVYIILLFSIIGFSCDGWLADKSLPKARGESGEIVLVLDSGRWAAEIGTELRQTFRELVDGLPRDEPMFDLRHIVPYDFKGILKQAKNLVLIVPLHDGSTESRRMQNLFTLGSLDSMKLNQKIFIIKKKNLFATGQEVLFLIGHSDDLLRDNIMKNREYIRSFFNQVEERRALIDLYKIKEEKLITNRLSDKFNFELRVPFGFKVAELKEDFVWLRQAGLDIDRNLFVSFKEYNNAADFSDEAIIEWRNTICKKHLYENKDNPNSFILTESQVPPTILEVNFEKKYAKFLKGLWKTNNISMGGPFVSYVLVDEDMNRMYYIEGFLYSPGVDQRELVRELNVILKTFKTKDEISA